MIDEAKIREITQACKLDLTDELTSECVQDLNKITQLKDDLNKIDTQDTPPSYYGNSLRDIYREDIAIKEENYQELLDRAPLTKDGYVVVPTIIED